MSKFLALIVAVAMALSLAGPAMAQTTDEGGVTTTGEVNVNGDVIYEDVDVSVLDDETVTKFFELDGNATSTWAIDGAGIMNIASYFQSGTGNEIGILQNPGGLPSDQINIANPYQFGNLNATIINQYPSTDPGIFSSNIAGGSQIGEGNIVNILQNPH